MIMKLIIVLLSLLSLARLQTTSTECDSFTPSSDLCGCVSYGGKQDTCGACYVSQTGSFNCYAQDTISADYCRTTLGGGWVYGDNARQACGSVSPSPSPSPTPDPSPSCSSFYDNCKCVQNSPCGVCRISYNGSGTTNYICLSTSSTCYSTYGGSFSRSQSTYCSGDTQTSGSSSSSSACTSYSTECSCIQGSVNCGWCKSSSGSGVCLSSAQSSYCSQIGGDYSTFASGCGSTPTPKKDFNEAKITGDVKGTITDAMRDVITTEVKKLLATKLGITENDISSTTEIRKNEGNTNSFIVNVVVSTNLVNEEKFNFAIQSINQGEIVNALRNQGINAQDVSIKAETAAFAHHILVFLGLLLVVFF